MCGIHGFINKKIASSDGHKLIQSMIDATIHRGPDFSNLSQIDGCYLGHNRLSIIDLSVSGNQPMFYKDFAISFNGEIYNYQEIRQELIQLGYQFQSSSDTEVILKGYEHWGESVVERFLGMWAFAIYNKVTQQLFCSRDRFGIKPFFYISNGIDFYFASEIKSLQKTPLYSSDLNLNQVSKGLQMGWIGFKEQTYFNSIKTLEPGSNLIVKASGDISISRYWEITSKPNLIVGSSFKSLFDESLMLHMRSDVPVGATLSGGLDSSSIVCRILDKKIAKDFHTFSIYYEGDHAVDERPFISEIDKKYPGQFTAHYYSPNQNEIEEDFHSISKALDFPMTGSSPISQYYVMQMVAKSGIKVVLSGQGADDYMGGYLHGFYRFFADKFSRFQWGSLMKEFMLYKEFQEASFGKITQVGLKSLLCVFLSEKFLYTTEYNNYLPFLINKGEIDKKLEFDEFKSSKLDSFHYSLMKYSSLPSLLHYEDRNSMAHSIESRVPFLDHRLVEFMFSSDETLKIKGAYTKRVLRDSMEGVLPSAIQYRKDKKGFVTPGEVVWLRGALKHLLIIDYDAIPFIDKRKTEQIIQSFQKGDNKYANLVWRIVSLNYWVKNFN